MFDGFRLVDSLLTFFLRLQGIGEFGTYQKILFVLLMFFSIFLVFIYFTQLFLTITPREYWCKLPHVDEITPERLKELLIPSSQKVPYEGHPLPYSRCWIYDVPIDTIIVAEEPDDDWPMKKCHEWEFKFTHTDVPYISIAVEQRWLCDEAYKATLAQSIFFVGAICGGLVFGWLSDKYGRIPILISTNMVGFIGGISTVGVTSFWQFCLCRFIVGLAYDNAFVIPYILVLEYIGPKWRTFVGNMSYGIFYCIMGMILPWIAFAIPDWRIFALVTSVPLVSVLLAPLVISESVRWLISKGKIEKALEIITKIEKINRATVPEDVYEKFMDYCLETTQDLAIKDYTIIDLFKTRRLRGITLLLIFTWCAISIVYDGHIRYLEYLDVNIFIVFTIASSTEFPSEILITYTLDICGRRLSLFFAGICSSLFSFCAAAMPLNIYFVLFAIISRFFINISYNVALQFAAELLPTVVRCEGVALIHIMGNAATFLSPFVAFSSRIHHNIPMIIMGVASFVSGLLCLFLPETLKQQLPQSLMDGELFGIDQSFWETPFTKKEPVEPVKHYLHAKHPAIRGSVLRNSLVSGHVGNLKRYEAVKAKVKEYRDRERTESLDTAPLSMKRATLLEKNYEKRQIRSNAAEMRGVEETSAKERIMEETELADSKDAEDKRADENMAQGTSKDST